MFKVFAWSLNSVPIQIFSHDGLSTRPVTVYLKQSRAKISVHLLTDIHDSGKAGGRRGVCPFTKHLITEEIKRDREGDSGSGIKARKMQ